jgi:hypothetical protein
MVFLEVLVVDQEYMDHVTNTLVEVVILDS